MTLFPCCGSAAVPPPPFLYLQRLSQYLYLPNKPISLFSVTRYKTEPLASSIDVSVTNRCSLHCSSPSVLIAIPYNLHLIHTIYWLMQHASRLVSIILWLELPSLCLFALRYLSLPVHLRPP